METIQHLHSKPGTVLHASRLWDPDVRIMNLPLPHSIPYTRSITTCPPTEDKIFEVVFNTSLSLPPLPFSAPISTQSLSILSPKSALFKEVAVSHVWLLKLKSELLSCTSYISRAPEPHACRSWTILDSTYKCFHHCRKFYWMGLPYIHLKAVLSPPAPLSLS